MYKSARAQKVFSRSLGSPPPPSDYDLETTHEGRCDVEDLGILESMILSSGVGRFFEQGGPRFRRAERAEKFC